MFKKRKKEKKSLLKCGRGIMCQCSMFKKKKKKAKDYYHSYYLKVSKKILRIHIGGGLGVMDKKIGYFVLLPDSYVRHCWILSNCVLVP